MKKLLWALWSAVLCLICACPAFAAQEGYRLALETDSSAVVGEPLTVTLTLSAAEGETLTHYAVATQVCYDSAALRLEGCTAHDDLSARSSSILGSTRRLVKLNNSALGKLEGTWENPAILLTMTFVPLTAQETEITVYSPGLGSAAGGDAEVTVTDLRVKIADAGGVCDLNGDGVTDIFDLQYLFDYLSGIVPEEERLRAMADCNGDGDVNILDYQQLYQLLTTPQKGA